MIKITYKDLKESRRSLEKLLIADMPIAAAIALNKIVKKVREEISELIKFEDSLLVKHGNLVPNTQNEFLIPPENREAYVTEYNTMLEMEIEFAEVSAFPIEWLGNQIMLSPLDIEVLKNHFLIVKDGD